MCIRDSSMIDYIELHKKFKENSLFGRYITLKNVEPLLDKYSTEVVSKSVLNKPIYKILIGKGNTTIFMWSQMHGNESTTTKALFDFLNFLNSNEDLAILLLEKFTFCILPMVNPDGAELYTRETVSYTHLDVYKRQLLIVPATNELSFFSTTLTKGNVILV